MSTIGADSKRCVDFDWAISGGCFETDYGAGFKNQIRHFCIHQQVKGRIPLGMRNDKIQEIPLWHEREKLTVGGEMSEVGELDELASDSPTDFANLGMRSREKIIQQFEFEDDLESRRVNRVAAEVSQKIRMLLEHDDFDARSRQ